MDTAISNISLVTVLMPVYNAEEYVKQAIESILLQTYSNFELLIIDDASTDASVEAIHSLKDDRIRFIQNEKNLGLIGTLNKGFDLAKGKYIARMDNDDLALPDRLKVQVDYLESHPEVGVFGSAYINLKDNVKGKTTTFLHNHDLLKSILFFNSCMAHPTVMFRKEFIKKNNLKYTAGYTHAEDYEFWVRAIDKTQFSNAQEPLLLYRIHDKQTSNSESRAQQETASRIRLMMISKLGLQPNETEMRIHNSIGNKLILKGFENIQYTEQWILKLVKANSKTHVVKEIPFNSYLAIVFQDVCANSSVGIKAYRFYNRSVLAQYSKKGFVFKLKLFFKCLLR